MRKLGHVLGLFGFAFIAMQSVSFNGGVIQTEPSQPQEVRAFVEEGRGHLADGNLDLARESYRQLLVAAENRTEPDAAFGASFALQMLARIEEASGNFENALDIRSQALALDSSKASKAFYATTKSHCQLSQSKRNSLSKAYQSLLSSCASCNTNQMFDAAHSIESELGRDHLSSRLAMLEFERLSQFPFLSVPAMEERISSLTEILGSDSIFVTDAKLVLGRRIGTHLRGPDANAAIEKLSCYQQVYARHAWFDSSRLFSCHLTQADCHVIQQNPGEAKQAIDLAEGVMASLEFSPQVELKFLTRKLDYGVGIKSPQIVSPAVVRGAKLLKQHPELVATATYEAVQMTGLSGFFFDFCRNAEKSNQCYSASETIISEHCPVEAERIAETVRLLMHWSTQEINSGEIEGAKKRIDRAVSLLPKSRSSQRAPAFATRGEILQRMGLYSESVTDLTAAIEMGGPHDSQPYFFRLRSRSHFLDGDTDKAISDVRKSFGLSIDRFKNTFVLADQISAIVMTEQLNMSRSVVHSIALKTKTASVIREAFEMSLRSKSIATRAITLLQRERPTDPELDRLRRKLDEISSKISRYAIDGRTKMTKDLEEERADVIYEMADRLPAGFLDDLNTEPGQLERLRNALPNDVAIIEFEEYRSDFREGGPDRVLAFVIRKDANAKLLIDIVDIAKTEELSKLIENREATMRQKVSASALLAVRGIKKERKKDIVREASPCDALWKQIGPLVGDHKKLIICPTGKLSKVGWGGLLTPDRKNYLAEKHQLIVNQSAHNVLRLLETDFAPKSGCLAVGGVDYGEVKLGDQKDPVESFGRLQFSLEEAKSTVASFARSKQPTKLLQGKEASIEKLQKHISDFGVIHIASHGYLAERDDVRKRGRGDDFYERFPLLRSSMVLANANSNRSAGLWTGEEILGTNMSHVDLAILSTCNSAAGIVLRSEEFGLQSAFELAGARSTLGNHSSLSDSKAKKFVEAFTKNWVENGFSKGAAFQQAQLEMIKEGIPVEYWQGWQLRGDWR